jgi:hypothetical protein
MARRSNAPAVTHAAVPTCMTTMQLVHSRMISSSARSLARMAEASIVVYYTFLINVPFSYCMRGGT